MIYSNKMTIAVILPIIKLWANIGAHTTILFLNATNFTILKKILNFKENLKNKVSVMKSKVLGPLS